MSGGNAGGTDSGTTGADARTVKAWRNGVVAAYAGSGLVFSTWVSRIPAIRDGLGLTPATVG